MMHRFLRALMPGLLAWAGIAIALGADACSGVHSVGDIGGVGGDGLRWRHVVQSGNQKLQVRRLTDHIWMHTSINDVPGVGPFPANRLIVEGAAEVGLINTTWTPGQLEALVTWVQRSLGKHIT